MITYTIGWVTALSLGIWLGWRARDRRGRWVTISTAQGSGRATGGNGSVVVANRLGHAGGGGNAGTVTSYRVRLP